MGISKRIYIGLTSLLVAAGALFAVLSITSGTADAFTAGTRRDCGYTDVIIDCGALTKEELLRKYDSNDDGRGNKDIHAIFSNYGIQRSDLTGQTSEIKLGWLNTNGTIVVDGKTVATNAKSLYRVDPGKPVSPIKINGKTYYTGSVNGSYGLGADLFVFFKNGVFHSAIQASCGNPISATPVKPPTPPKPQAKPVYSCDNLKATQISRTKYSFTTSATAKDGAEIVSYTYNFGDGKTTTTTNKTVEHEYAKAGKYTAKVSVNVKASGSNKTVTSTDCQTSITVEEAPKNPVYSCDLLKAEKVSRTKYNFTATATAENGAEITNYFFNFGDGKSVSTTSSEVSHEYGQPGDYNVFVNVNVRVNGESTVVTSENCKVVVTVSEEEKPFEYCEVPGKEYLPKDSPDCVETPIELPRTGVDTIIGGGLGIGSITAASYYWLGSRRNLLDALLNK